MYRYEWVVVVHTVCDGLWVTYGATGCQDIVRNKIVIILVLMKSKLYDYGIAIEAIPPKCIISV